MNIQVSYNWLKEYVATGKSAKDFASALSKSGPTVDFIYQSKPNFSQVVVGEIKSIATHPNADKLHLCQVDVGKKILTIVCGAPNIKEGQKVPVVTVGGKVGDLDIKLTKIRGEESQGMMCSAKELGLGEDHSGIYILPDYTTTGLPLEKVLSFDDFIFDVEVTSNRPDAMSVVGLAREASAIMGEKYLYKEPTPSLKKIANKPLLINVQDQKLCPRYQAIVMTDVKVEPSPLWMQQRLLSSGLRPINNLVDITNYVLLEFGQPMHVFDYEKLTGSTINVRKAKKGETILALDGKSYEVSSDNLIIADAKNPIAIAGVMGGQLSSATAETKTIVLESANFNAISIRKTARILNLHSDSSNLFEKGLQPDNTHPAMLRAVELVKELANGQIASATGDIKSYKSSTLKIELDAIKVYKLLGINIDLKTIKNILTRLGFGVTGAKKLTVTVPWWRIGDIEADHDLIEEIARVYGYDNLPTAMPTGNIPAVYENHNLFYWTDKIKDYLMAMGMTENYNYSFISKQLIDNLSLNIDDHVKIANPLSADFEYMRTSLTAGLLQSMADNQGKFGQIKIFELSKICELKKDDLPNEKYRLSLASNGSDKSRIFYELKGVVEALLKKLNITDFNFTLISEGRIWQPNTLIGLNVNGNLVGKIGLINQEILYLFGLKKSVALVDIDVEQIINSAKTNPNYQPLAKYPSVDLDLSMEIDKSYFYQDVVALIKGVDSLIKDVSFLSAFSDKNMTEEQVALAIRIIYRDDKKTLTLDEAQTIHNKVVKVLEKRYNIKVR